MNKQQIDTLLLSALILFLIASILIIIGLYYEQKNKNREYLDRKLETHKRNIEWPLEQE